MAQRDAEPSGMATVRLRLNQSDLARMAGGSRPEGEQVMTGGTTFEGEAIVVGYQDVGDRRDAAVWVESEEGWRLVDSDERVFFGEGRSEMSSPISAA